MPVTKAQLTAFADTHSWRIPFDTSPRHLAGPGDARHVTHGLAAAGWKHLSDPLSPQIEMRSPDARYSLRFDPQSSVSSWWMLSAQATDTEPGWYATFGEFVPAELIGALTDALLTPPAEQLPDVSSALTSAGWRHAPGSEQTTSPDGMCRFEQERLAGYSANEQSWRFEACRLGYDLPRGSRIWHATFDDRAPVHLVHAFACALADPAPLQRGMHDRTADFHVHQEPSPLTPEQVVAAHTSRLDAIRAQVRAARRQHQAQARSAQVRPSLPAARRR
ncbi:DUF317 domain-containing protein [Streptomyces sp. DSM 42041]|uniref:DUF317 domain-containing protein n=1 Tax=Streptomyces hazeniae TaxID=3075538 RepID=A0ABU2NZY4_9ACTN|nr:DUF317 domain-containing protein [Streptomyces sp. DSM 42041]MDT0382559.1 DUF317 domain-containing protein [Streptomyces sp. DSM 42041]